MRCRCWGCRSNGSACEFVKEGLVAFGAEEVAGVEVAFLPGFFGGLFELPVVEAGAEAGSDRLVFVRPLVVTQTIIRQPQCRRQMPAFAIVPTEAGINSQWDVPVACVNQHDQIQKGNKCQNKAV